ncbi:MAG TPA: PD-(D/E)XK nuclease family protein, partial [Candidatus Krumholzibacteria bacterium]
YSMCPFVFFVRRVLRLDDAQEADEQLSPLVFGGIAHRVLERFYSEVKENLPAVLEGEARELFERIIEETFAEREKAGEWLGLPVLGPVTKRSLRAAVHDYIVWELAHLHKKNEMPYLIEHEFGFEEPVVIRGASIDGKQVDLRVRGRIDRVDRHGEGEKTRHHVLDYKSSTIPSKSGYKDGSLLQGPIYLRVLEESGLAVGKCRYRRIRFPGDPQNGAELAVGHEDCDRALTIAFSIPERVRAGLFEAALPANADDWPWFFPGREICRSQAQLQEGSRFDLAQRQAKVDGAQPPGGRSGQEGSRSDPAQRQAEVEGAEPSGVAPVKKEAGSIKKEAGSIPPNGKRKSMGHSPRGGVPDA